MYKLLFMFLLFLPIYCFQIIQINPGGLHGFYMLGICKYLKKNYNLDDFNYYGASAGSWNSLFMTYKHNNTEFINTIQNYDISHVKSIYHLQILMKEHLLKNYKTDDFNLDKLNIAVTTLHKPPFFLKSNIYNNFNSLEDAIDCCIASSHLPIFSGKVIMKYDNKICFDGGLFQKNMIVNKDKIFLITPNLWNKEKPYINKLKELDIPFMINYGYENSEKHKTELEEFFKKN